MLTDHKLRQEMYHKLERLEDVLENKDYIVTDTIDSELIDQIIEYFTVPLKQLVYPAKSYAVAIIYADMLDEHFGVPFYDSLNDPNLFIGTDRFFVLYNQAEHIYEDVFEYLDEYSLAEPFNKNLPQIKTTIGFFKKEFYINPNPYFNNIDLA